MDSEELRKVGVFVVTEKGSYDSDVIGVAGSLAGAMSLVLDAGEFELLSPAADGDGWDAVKVDSTDPRAEKAFKWVNEGTYKLEMGSGKMTAYFQDEARGFHVHWTMFRE